MEDVNKKPFWRKIKGEQLADFLNEIRQQEQAATENLAFVCIGTDRSSGDSLGPLVGSELEEAGYPYVIGTLKEPCDASNLEQRLLEIPQGSKVIAIDACLGQALSVGYYQVSNQPILPGKSVGKVLPRVGDFTIAAIVNADGPKQYAILQTTSLFHVMGMAKQIAAAIQEVFPR